MLGEEQGHLVTCLSIKTEVMDRILTQDTQQFLKTPLKMSYYLELQMPTMLFSFLVGSSFIGQFQSCDNVMLASVGEKLDPIL